MYFYTVPVGGIVVTNFTMKFLLSETIFLLLPNSDHKTNIFMSFSIHKVSMNKIVLWINICVLSPGYVFINRKNNRGIWFA